MVGFFWRVKDLITMTKRIAYFSLTEDVYGGERMLLNLILGLDRIRFDPVVFIPGTGKLSAELGRHAIKHAIRKAQNINAFVAPYQIVKAIMFLRRNRIQLIHINSAIYWRLVDIIAASLMNIPIVTHTHLVIEEMTPYLKFSDVIIFNSEFTAASSIATKNITKVIYNSVNTDDFDMAVDTRAALGFATEDVIVTFIGQIKQIKGIEMFIELANQIEAERAKFLIAGDCQDQDYLSELQARITDNKRIKYIGYRSDRENIYKSSDVIIMPSQWEEPFGLINIEAGAARKPIIATKVGGIPEIIQHGQNGFLIAKDDLTSLVAYTNALIGDKTLREKMGKQGREIVERKFSNSVYVSAVQDVYEELLDKTVPRSTL